MVLIKASYTLREIFHQYVVKVIVYILMQNAVENFYQHTFKIHVRNVKSI